MLEVIELFSGIGAQRSALIKANIPHRVVAFCDIDKYAEKSYREIFQDYTTPNLGDITKVKQLPKCDLLTYSFPCTDISTAGKIKGMNNSNKITTGLFQFDDDLEEPQTRSGLVYEVLRLLNCSEKPKYLLLENVKNLVGKFMDDFKTILDELDKLGYNTYWKVLDAQYFGIPQHRERVFAISIRKDIDDHKFMFPKTRPLTLKLKDMLEENVDDKYYLSEKMITYIMSSGTKNFYVKPEIDLEIARPITTCPNKRAGTTNYVSVKYSDYSIKKIQKNIDNMSDELCPTLTANCMQSINHDNCVLIPEATKQGYAIAEDGDGVYINRPYQKRGVVQKNMIPTLKTSCNDIGVVVNNGSYLFIRKLTPLECWRLMGFKDEQFYRAQRVNSDCQLYKQAGNSIVVNVLADIFTNLFKEE